MHECYAHALECSCSPAQAQAAETQESTLHACASAAVPWQHSCVCPLRCRTSTGTSCRSLTTTPRPTNNRDVARHHTPETTLFHCTAPFTFLPSLHPSTAPFCILGTGPAPAMVSFIRYTYVLHRKPENVSTGSMHGIGQIRTIILNTYEPRAMRNR